MSTDLEIADADARSRALDVTRSFIVQAPAGSGKTELLIRRFLALLQTVEQPESVLAITFTRKAAAEMRSRILGALEGARGMDDAANDATLALARRVLEADTQRGWRLLDNPSRLRILTIDAFNIALARRLPVLSGIGAGLGIEERARPLYRTAAERLLQHLAEPDSAAGQAVAHLLEHLDNRSNSFVALVEELLARREDWLAVLQQLHGDRQALRLRLEQARHDLVTSHLLTLSASFPAQALRDAARLASVAVPDSSAASQPRWMALADLLLTKQATWRSARGVKNGALAGLIAELQQIDRLDELLAAVRQLPDAHYSEPEWQALAAMFAALPVAASELQLVFAETGRGDYPCFAAAARQALGTEEEPGDLALALDARLHHVLVDEFQDTSLGQVRLLERLTAEWTTGDGNTLFLVGDPMQSIYRFRNAEVAQFLAARQHGIGRLRLEPLRLSVNFRSRPELIAWHNSAFSQVLPRTDDLRRAAVAFSPSTASPRALPGGNVTVHASLRDDREAEAEKVADLIVAALSRDPNGSIAVLVAGRSHLTQVVAALQRRRIAFQATDIDPLAERPVVLDLLALTRALAHPGDRTSWLSVLRAPWCGLELADLHAIVGEQRGVVLELLQDVAWRERVAEVTRERVDRTCEVLSRARGELRRLGLRDTVERAWHSLGGPATVENERALAEAAAFFVQLSALEARRRGPLDLTELDDVLAELYAPPDPEPGLKVQLMTIHKAKGLQFDTVIVPGLHRPMRASGPALLQWTTLHGPGHDSLVVAPVQPTGSGRSALYGWLDGIARDQNQHERERLLYVAATRAKSALHLLGSAGVKDDGSLKTPRRATLLGALWPAVRQEFENELARHGPPAVASLELQPAIPLLRRLPVDWKLPSAPAGPPLPPRRAERVLQPQRPEFDWATETARHVGTVVHGALQRWARAGAFPDEDMLAASGPLFTIELAELGVPQSRLAGAAARVQQALSQTLADPRGRWLFDASHRDAAAELSLTGRIDDELVSVVVDRTFIDASGTRWIVDYKTSVHEGGGLDSFLNAEQTRYRVQLERYARLMQALGPERIRVGLYFPLFPAWREWDIT